MTPPLSRPPIEDPPPFFKINTLSAEKNSSPFGMDLAVQPLILRETMEKRTRKILLVDDDLNFMKPLQAFLELHGFQVSVASDGYSAISILRVESHDVVLLDLRLPDIGGVQVLKSIKEINEEVTVIAITGHGGQYVATELMKTGAADFLSKPIDYEVLLGKIDRVLKISDALRERNRFKRRTSLMHLFPLIAYKIRNSLQTIALAIALIQKRSNLEEHLVSQSIGIIQKETEHLKEFIQQCLGFVRPSMSAGFTAVDINDLIGIAKDLVSHRLKASLGGIQVEMHLDPQLPQIHADYDQIKEALMNITRNVVESMPEGGNLAIETHHQPNPPPGWVEVVIGETGKGSESRTARNPLCLPSRQSRREAVQGWPSSRRSSRKGIRAKYALSVRMAKG